MVSPSMQGTQFAAAVFAAFSVVSCGSGSKLAATGSGDLSNAPAPRLQSDAQFLSECGNAELLGKAPVFRRKPYVQLVTEDSARVLFTTLERGQFEVELTQPDGSLVAESEAQVAPDITPPGAVAQYEARFTGLEPDTLYCYAVPGVTTRTGFRTAPAPNSPTPVRILAFGDSGTGDSYQRTVALQMRMVPIDLALHTGDVAYDSGKPDELERSFFDVYAALTKNFPAYPISGNHDYKTLEAVPLRNAFALPETASPGFEERFFSFNWGNVHFVGLDTERMTSAHADWLEHDLANNTREWVIVYGHRPPYSSGEHGSNSLFQKVFGPVLEKYRVPLVLSGHEHNYERTHPIRGVTYVVTGGGGRETRPVNPSSFTAYAEDVLHFVYIEVKGRELVLHAIDGVGREFDSARLTLD